MPWSFYNSNGKLIDGVIDGSITNAKLADDAVGADELAENAVVDASIASGALIAFSKLANLTDGNILVGNGSNVPTSVNPTGDLDIANDGTISLNSTAISGFDAKTSVADADTLLIGDSAASNALKKMTKANLMKSVFRYPFMTIKVVFWIHFQAILITFGATFWSTFVPFLAHFLVQFWINFG